MVGGEVGAEFVGEGRKGEGSMEGRGTEGRKPVATVRLILPDLEMVLPPAPALPRSLKTRLEDRLRPPASLDLRDDTLEFLVRPFGT